MITKIKEIPTRAFVHMQTAGFYGQQKNKGRGVIASLLPRTSLDRAAMAFGAAVTMVVYSLTVHASAATPAPEGFLKVVNTFTQFAFYLLGAGSFIMALAAALMFVTAAGNPKMISRGKETIKYVVLGLVLMAAFYAGQQVIVGLADPGKDNTSVTNGITKNQDTQRNQLGK